MNIEILLVDDEEDILDLIAEILEPINYSVFKARSGKEAIDIVRDNNISLILSDIKMPIMGGLEMFKNIKETLPDKAYALEVIFVSGYADVKLSRQLISSGAFDIIDKPFSDDIVRNRVNNAILKVKERQLQFQIMTKIVKNLDLKINDDFKKLSPIKRIDRLGKIVSILDIRLLNCKRCK